MKNDALSFNVQLQFNQAAKNFSGTWFVSSF